MKQMGFATERISFSPMRRKLRSVSCVLQNSQNARHQKIHVLFQPYSLRGGVFVWRLIMILLEEGVSRFFVH